MRIAAASLAVLLAIWMAWRGYRRGALATVLGWLPMLSAAAVLLAVVRAAWREPSHFGAMCLLGGVAAAAVFGAGELMLRARRRRPKAAPAADAQGAGRRRWLNRPNHVAGAALGVLCSALLCLALACLGSTVPFAFSVAEEVAAESGDASPAPPWVGALREACCTMADLSDFAVLRHIPRLRAYSREVRSLVVILNAPRDKLAHVARKRGLTRLKDVPEMKRALSDQGYIRLLVRLGEGDLTAVAGLARHPITRHALACPQIRELTGQLTPSQLAKDLEAAPCGAEPQVNRSPPCDSPSRNTPPN